MGKEAGGTGDDEEWLWLSCRPRCASGGILVVLRSNVAEWIAD